MLLTLILLANEMSNRSTILMLTAWKYEIGTTDLKLPCGPATETRIKREKKWTDNLLSLWITQAPQLNG